MSLEGTVFGYYRLLQIIGSGGMGEVYLAEDTRIARRVAVKVVRSEFDPYPNAPATQEAIRLFQREMKAIATLDHPNILPLIDFGEQTVNRAVFTYLVMPFRPEGSLVDWLHRRGGNLLSSEEVTPLVLQAAEALQHAHNHQIVHLDVKLSNFLVRERETSGHVPDLLLTDFGIARFSTATSTASQNVRGTPSSMAPEQWAGHPVAASDQYALAIMAYQLLTGALPFQGNMQQMMYKHLNESPQPPSAYAPRLSPQLDMLLLRALAKRPEERFPSILAFATAFQQGWSDDLPTVLSAQAMRATPPPPSSFTSLPSPPQAVTEPQKEQSSSSQRQNRLSLIVILSLLILILGSAITFAFFHFQSSGTTTSSNKVNQSTNSGAPLTSTVGSTTTDTIAQTPTPTLSPTPVPITNIPYGKLLYTTSTPGSKCDSGGGQWADYNQPGIQCSATNSTISNTSSTSPDLRGTILTGIPNGTYPNNYVVEAQMQQANTSSDFGLYFRNQPGNQQGIYTFFIHPNGTWGAYVYDNTTGAQTQIASGTTSIDPHAQLRLTVAAVGADFTFYVNGKTVGNAHDTTYSTGTVGIAVDAGGTITVSKVGLYSVA